MSHSQPFTHRHCVLIIAVATLLVYLPALSAGFLAVDDTDTLGFVQSRVISLKDLFFSGAGQYYRPLTILSFIADFHLFGGNPAGYHLTNIVLHLANSLLVYWLAHLLCKNTKEQVPTRYPLAASLIFALHPINSEAVVWISARTDVLCCFFCLLSLVLLIRSPQSMSPFTFVSIGASFFCSLAAKEASLFLPLFVGIYYFLERKNLSLRATAAGSGAIILGGALYLVLRQGLQLAADQPPDPALIPDRSLSTLMIDTAAVVGFYVSKLVVPVPLSIAITSINKVLGWLFFLAAGIGGTILWHKIRSARLPLAFLAFALTPPLGAWYLGLAWTPFAERYLYLPSAAFALGIATLFKTYSQKLHGVLLAGLLILLAAPTMQRVHLWNQPLAFWQSTAEVSPRFGTVRLVLAAEYLQAGRCSDALSSLHSAETLGLERQTAKEFHGRLKELIKKTCTAPSQKALPLQKPLLQHLSGA